jgi:hypothetical protein
MAFLLRENGVYFMSFGKPREARTNEVPSTSRPQQQ